MKITKRTKIIFTLATTLLLVTPLFFKQEKSTLNISEVYNTQGIDASLINVKNTDVLYFKIKFKNAGILHNLLDSHGISIVLKDIIFRRMKGLSYAETEQKFQQLGIFYLKIEARHNDFEISFSVLKDNVDEALKFIAPALEHPEFTENELEYIKNRYPHVIDLENSPPETIMLDELWQLLYKNNAYGLNQTGTANAISKIKSSDLYNFVEKNFTKNRLEVFIVGDISRFDAAQYLSILFGKLPKGETSIPMFNSDESIEKEKFLEKNSMDNLVGIMFGIRLDELSDIQKATANIIIDALFSENGDFEASLRKENIPCLQYARIVHQRYSSVFYISCYVDKKYYEKYLAFMRSQIQKYSKTQNLIQLERYQKYYERRIKTGPINFEDIDEVIEKKSLPYGDVTRKNFANMAMELFDLKRGKVVILKKN